MKKILNAIKEWWKKAWSGWSWTEFVRGILNKRFLSFAVATWFVQKGVFDGQSDDIKRWLIIAWGVIAAVWILGSSLEKLVENGKLNVDLSAKVGK